MRKWIAMLLLAAILVSALPVSAAAVGEKDSQKVTSAEEKGDFSSYIPIHAQGELTAQIRTVRSGSYEPLVTSQPLIDIIKEKEGFTKYPVWDYGHWAIGYGTTCPEDMLEEYRERGITEEEAEALLREYVATFEDSVNSYGRRKGIQFSQCQFDGLIDFTYALGPAWTTMNCMLTSWLQNPTSDIDFVNAIGRWCRVSGDVWGGTCARRIMEAKIFLYGDYDGTGEHDFSYVIFHGVLAKMTSSYEDDVAYYEDGEPYGQLPQPVLEGYRFLGWFTSKEGGTELKATDIVKKYMTVYAHWEQLDVPEPTEPEPTEPEPTEPAPTEPEPTEPEPTEPEPTAEPEPDPTEPDEPEIPFTDVPEDSWFYDAVAYMYKAKLVKGISETEFGPGMKLTRGMLITLFYRLDGQPEVTQPCTFTDVNPNLYYADAIAWAQQHKIVVGDGENLYHPDAQITRQDTVVIMHRFCIYIMGLDCPPNGDLSGFPDADRISPYAKEAMIWAVGAGLINGYQEDKTIRPGGNINRAETAKIFYNLYQKLGG